jgi:hypothetical protein
MRKISQYHACGDFKKVNMITNHFNNLNPKIYPRKFGAHTRKALSKLSPQSPTKHLAGMKSTFFENDKLKDTLMDDFKNKAMVIPGQIKFGFGLPEEQRSTDKRLQLAFAAESATHKAVCKLLRDQQLYNPEKESISDVSLIIGGTAIQDPHGDHPRVFSGFKRNEASHEINRKKYNEAMNSTYAHSSILSGFDKCFKLAIPDCYLEQNNTFTFPKMVKAKRSSDEFKSLDSTKFICHNNNGITFDMVTIEVPSEGCQFVGDFMHAGANNVTGCLTENEENAFNLLILEAASIIDQNKKKKQYFQLFKLLQSANYLTKITRFFCRTISKEHRDLLVPYQNIMPLHDNVCQYDDHYADSDATQEIIYGNPKENSTAPEVKMPLRNRSKLTDQSKLATDGAKNDQQKYPPKGTKKTQKKQTKDQTTNSPSAKKDQQKDTPKDQDQTKSPPAPLSDATQEIIYGNPEENSSAPEVKMQLQKTQKKQTKDETKSPPAKNYQQNNTSKAQTNSSPAKRRSAKSPDSTTPVSNRFSSYLDNDKINLVIRNMDEFQSSEWAIGRARNNDSKLYKNRLKREIYCARERGDAAKTLITKEKIPLFLGGTPQAKKTAKCYLPRKTHFTCTLILIHT